MKREPECPMSRPDPVFSGTNRRLGKMVPSHFSDFSDINTSRRCTVIGTTISKRGRTVFWIPLQTLDIRVESNVFCLTGETESRLVAFTFYQQFETGHGFFYLMYKCFLHLCPCVALDCFMHFIKKLNAHSIQSIPDFSHMKCYFYRRNNTNQKGGWF